MFKQIRFLLTTLLLLIVATVSADKVQVGDLFYELSGTEATVVYPGESEPTAAGTNSYTGDIVIPATIEVGGTTYNVTKVGDKAFRYSTVTSITMNEGLVSAGSSSFNNMTEVTELTFPNSFTKTGGGDPLSGCTNLKKITFGTGLTKISQGFCFSGTPLEDIYFYGATPPAERGGYFCAGCADVKMHVLETAVDAYTSVWTSIGWGTAPNIVGDIPAEYTYEDLQSVIGVYSKKLYYVGEGLGFYTAESATALQAAISDGSAVAEGLTSDDYRTAVKAIQNAALELVESDATVTEGYYYFVSDNAGILNNGKSKKAAYLTNEKLFWGELDEADPKFVLKLTKGETEGTWNVSDPYNNNVYVGEATGFCSDFLNSDTPAPLYLKYLGEGSFRWYSMAGTQEWAMCPSGNPNGDKDGPNKVWAYNSANASHNEATWALIPVTFDPQQKLQELETAIEAIKTPINAENYKTNLQGTERGAVTSPADKAAVQEALDAAKAVVNSDTASDTEKVAAYSAAKAAYDACPKDNPIVDGYYYIYAIFDGLPISYKTVDDADYAYKTTWSDPASALDMGSVFNVKNVGENAYTVQNVKTGKYLGAYNTTHNPSEKGSFALQTDAYTTYIVPWRSSHNYLDAGKNYGEVTDAISFCLYSEATLENEYSGRWTGSGWNIHADYNDFVAHAWRLLPVDDAYNAYMAEKDYNDLIAAANEALAVPTPANHHDNDPARDRSFLLGNEKTSVDGLATSKEAHDALQAAYDAVVAAHAEGQDEAAAPAIYQALRDAMAVVNAKSNPLVDGYYYLVAEYDANTDGIAGGYVIEATADGIAKVQYDATNPKQIFQVEYDAANGKVYLQNVATQKWLGVVDGNAWKQSDTKVALNVMSGKDHYWYWGSPKNDAARSCSFILYDDDAKGISSGNCGVTANVTNTGSYAWVISWAFRPADEGYEQYQKDEEEQTGIHYWEVATEPSAPVSGKTYVIKNAVSDLYLTAGVGVADTFNPLEKNAIWQIDETTTEVDGNKTYTLKSIEEDGYWKYINYDEQPGYDGYDWFGYAGMNAEFSTAAEAELFTILTPEQSATKTRNSVKESQAVVDGAYVITAKEQIGGNWFKLDTQRGTDAALEPWQDAPQWLFYEATKGTDSNREIELALDAYKLTIEDEAVGTEPGFYNADKVAAYRAAYAALEDVLANGVSNAEVKYASEIQDGTEYFIVSDRKKFRGNTNGVPKAMACLQSSFTINWGDQFVYWGDLDKTSDGFVWTAERVGTQWAFKNKEKGQYIGHQNDADDDVLFSTDPVGFTLTDLSDGAGRFYLENDEVEYSPHVQGFLRSDRPNNSLARQSVGVTTYIDDVEEFGYPGRWHFVPAEMSARDERIGVRTAIETLAAAYEVAQEVNPVVVGNYYVLINDNAKIKENGKPEKAMWINTEKSDKRLYWGEYNADDLKFVFQAVDGGEDNTVYLYNLSTGLYTGGATEFCGNFPSTEDPTYPATFHFYPGTGSAYIKANNWTMCPNGNPGGDKDGPAKVWAYNGENGQPFQEVTWTVRTVDNASVEQMVNNALIDVVAKYENTTFDTKEAPGYCKQENVDAFTTAFNTANDLGLASPVDTKLAAIANLDKAYSKAINDVQPITDGYYFLVNKYAWYEQKYGAPAAMYTTPDVKFDSGASAVYYDTFDASNAHFLFKLTAKEGVENGFYAQNAADSWYLNTGDGDSWYNEKTTCTETPVNAQLFKPYQVGMFFVADEVDTDVSRCTYSRSSIDKLVPRYTIKGYTTISDNIKDDYKWYNAWELIPVTDEDAAAIIAATAAADAAAKASFDRMNDFATTSAATIAEYTADESPLSADVKQALKDAVAAIQSAITSRPADVVTPATTYDELLRTAENLLTLADEEVNPKPLYWEIAADPSVPEAGKSYIIKNAYNDFYLYAGEDKGVNAPAFAKDNYVYTSEYIWALEDAGTVTDDNWEKGDALLTDASQITSNNTQDGFPTSNLLRPESDGYSTGQYIWHTSWDAPLPTGTNTYLQTTFASAEQHIMFTMVSSEWNSTYDTPDVVDIYATSTPDDETSWQLITTLDDMIANKNAHPTFYTSPHIDLGAAYTAVRFVVKKTTMAAYDARYDANKNPYVSLGRFQVYSAENNGTVNGAYALKSFPKNAYWKHVDYASQTWDASTPYDGYDWYDYKGMNAEFGFADEA
ncbi:MAG: leucine-rich repeat domain-containing protein, partial [Bacteroidaceae bacterium]|nr:leucine-rich repeat domain-containing protein [Bacteroidaceae bacterium]